MFLLLASFAAGCWPSDRPLFIPVPAAGFDLLENGADHFVYKAYGDGTSNVLSGVVLTGGLIENPATGSDPLHKAVSIAIVDPLAAKFLNLNIDLRAITAGDFPKDGTISYINGLKLCPLFNGLATYSSLGDDWSIDINLICTTFEPGKPFTTLSGKVFGRRSCCLSHP
jgi:hypothetical protein